MKIGANYSIKRTDFTVWAPNQNKVFLVLPKENEILEMNKDKSGYWTLQVEEIKPKTRYMFRLDDQKNRPDPASHFQPDGVFGSSEVVDHSAHVWEDSDWKGIKLEDLVTYELHIGAFTKQGTFEAAKKRARDLSALGVNAVELMPVSQFSGARNWGYDAVFTFAVQNTYGGPDQLKKLVEEFHKNGIAVFLDVVYNHIGPEGNFLSDFGPYFQFNRMSPWGPTINFDGPQSHHVRNFFFENAVYWLQNYHVDGLRLDAIFAITDNSPKHFLKELSETVDKLSTKQKKLLLIGENDQVDPKILDSPNAGGFGLDAVWHDTLHHSLHALLTGERNWYYSSFGKVSQVKEALQKEYANCNPAPLENSEVCIEQKINPKKLVVFSQNHDQIGNRPMGERLIKLAGVEAAKLSAGITILSQYSPLLFMGEEYGEDAPFLFFTDFSSKLLGEKVCLGRKIEIKKNAWKDQPPDPQNPLTFESSKINWEKRVSEKGRKILKYYATLLELKKTLGDRDANKQLQTKFIVSKDELLLFLQKETIDYSMVTVANFGKQSEQYRFPFGGGSYIKFLDSADTAWLGPGSGLPKKAELGDEHTINPLSMSVFIKQKEKK
jgi:maltooligosyltrehalose trehalohydrolase